MKLPNGDIDHTKNVIKVSPPELNHNINRCHIYSRTSLSFPFSPLACDGVKTDPWNPYKWTCIRPYLPPSSHFRWLDVNGHAPSYICSHQITSRNVYLDTDIMWLVQRNSICIFWLPIGRVGLGRGGGQFPPDSPQKRPPQQQLHCAYSNLVYRGSSVPLLTAVVCTGF